MHKAESKPDMPSSQRPSWMKHLDFMVLDLLVLAIAFTIAYAIKFDDLNFVQSATWRSLFILVLLTDAVLILFTGPFSGILRRGYWEDIGSSLKLALWNFVVACIVFYLFKIGEDYSREMLITTYILYLILSIASKALYKKFLLSYMKNKLRDSSWRLILITSSGYADEAIKLASSDDLGSIEILGVCLTDSEKPCNIEGIDTVPLSEIVEFCITHQVDEVLVFVEAPSIDALVYETLMEHGIRVGFAIDEITGVSAESKMLGHTGALSTLELERYSFGTQQMFYLTIKRLFDIVFGAAGCVLTLPIIGVVKVVYVLQGDTHPIFYKQERVGLRGEPFYLYKIRTMVWNSKEILEKLLQDPQYKEEWDQNQKFEDDPRITKVGRFLRRTSLDEFPQFFNVLMGKMSIVGPRPLVPGELEAHNGSSLYNKVKPGITGWWGCNGRSNIEYRERLELEYHYVRHCSLYLDTVCVMRTCAALIKHDGAQ